MDYVHRWTGRAELPAKRRLGWLGLGTSKFHDWKRRYGQANEHNGTVPRDAWLADWEKRAILDFHERHPFDGYRRLTFMMLDDDVAASAPPADQPTAGARRVLKQAGRLDRRNFTPSKKGTGFVQPLRSHEHWHVDVSYINLAGTFYFLCSVLDGCSRYLVHWELRETMKEYEVETIVQRGLEKFPGQRPRIISDNGPPTTAARRCPIARDFKEFIRLTGMTHVRTSPYYPQNGKIEPTTAARRALLRSGHRAQRGPSADPGAEPDEGGRKPPRPSPHHPAWHERGKPSRHDAAIPRQDARSAQNHDGKDFQFPLNQHTGICAITRYLCNNPVSVQYPGICAISGVGRAGVSAQPGAHTTTRGGGEGPSTKGARDAYRTKPRRQMRYGGE